MVDEKESPPTEEAENIYDIIIREAREEERLRSLQSLKEQLTKIVPPELNTKPVDNPKNEAEERIRSEFDIMVKEYDEKSFMDKRDQYREQLQGTFSVSELGKPTDNEYKNLNIPLNGRLRTAVDGTMIGLGDFQILKNMRYTETSIKSITGTTKINTAIIHATYYRLRSGFQFDKAKYPTSSQVLAQSWNAGLTQSYVYVNTTAIPSQGAFTATQVLNETAGCLIGRFSNAPDDCVAYANGYETAIWGGPESRCTGFLVGDDDLSVMYDYSKEVNNTLDDVNNVATIYTTTLTPAGVLHMALDNNVGDTLAVHTPVATNITYSTSIKKWGYSAYFNGTSAFIRVPDHANFTFTDGKFTIDFQMYIESTAGSSMALYQQHTDANNYILIACEKSGATWRIRFSVWATAGGPGEMIGTSGLATGYDLSDSTWYHIEVSGDGTSYYIFINGTLSASVTDTSKPADYGGATPIGDVHIGYDAIGATYYFKGYLDEFRVSSDSTHTASFCPPMFPYSGSVAYCYVGANRLLRGAKFYLKQVNTTGALGSESVANVAYWYGGKWVICSDVVDGTYATYKTLAQNGSISYSSYTFGSPRILNGIYQYWYLFTFFNINTSTRPTVYYITLDCHFQQAVDLWDGVYRPVAACWRYMNYTGMNEKYLDNTINVLDQDFVVGDTTTFMSLTGMTNTQWIEMGFTERACGFKVKFVHSGLTNQDRTNENACTMSVYYWNGSGWTAVTGLVDGTINDSTDSFGHNGNVTWEPPAEYLEFPKIVSGNIEPYYYYKVAFSATLVSATLVWVDQFQGIPAQKRIAGYKYPVMWQNRLVYLNNRDEKPNSCIISAQNTVCVFNGSDAKSPDSPIEFGDSGGLVAGGSVFSRFGGNTFEDLIVCKKDETWILSGTKPENYQLYKVSNDGCIAPGTFISCNTGYEIAPGVYKHVLIWQSDASINLFDGNAIIPISDDIKDLFDRTKTTSIYTSMSDKSEAFFDERELEYHWLFASGSSTTLDSEWVYDLRKKKWYQIDRSTGAYLQIGFRVRDTYGNSYAYGGLDSGYVVRLENGTTFVTASSANNIASTFKTGDMALGDWQNTAEIRKIRHMVKAKATSTQSVSITHFGDCNLTATTNKNTGAAVTVTHAVKSTTYRVLKKIESVGWGNFNFHALNCTITTSDENVGYEPIGLSVRYKIIREEMM